MYDGMEDKVVLEYVVGTEEYEERLNDDGTIQDPPDTGVQPYPSQPRPSNSQPPPPVKIDVILK